MVPKRKSVGGVGALAAEAVLPDAREAGLSALFARTFPDSLDDAGLPETSGVVNVTPEADLELLSALEGVETGLTLDFFADD